MIRNIDIDLLRCFSTVVEHRNFTRAASLLGRSQSTISMQIRQLESIVGQTLLLRSPQQISITGAGEEFLAYARRIVGLHDEAITKLNARPTKGPVRLAVMDDFATLILPDALARFSHAHPDVALEVTTGFTRDLLRQLGIDYDVVLATQLAGSRRGVVLRAEKTAWAFSREHELPPFDPVPLALLKSGNMFREWALEALTAAQLPWRIAFSSSSNAVVEAMAACGMAVTIVKVRTARPDLRLLDEAEGLPPLPEAEIALHIAPGKISSAARLLGDHLAETLRD